MMPPFMLGGLSSPVNMDFSSLNIEQLVAVEGQERQNVEARINMLRTIHALLDAAIVQLNQYTQMINDQRQPPVTVSNPSTAAGPSGETTGTGPSGATGGGPSGLKTTGPSGSGSSEAGPSGLGSSVGAEVSPGSSTVAGPAGSKSAVSEARDNSQTNSAELNDENSEIRRRRLERFSSTLSQEGSEKDKND